MASPEKNVNDEFMLNEYESVAAAHFDSQAGYGIPARAAEFRERVTRASAWLQKAMPRSTYEHALQLLALSAAGVGKDAVKRVAD